MINRNKNDEEELFNKSCREIIDEINESYKGINYPYIQYTPMNRFKNVDNITKQDLLIMFEEELNRKQFHIDELEFKIRDLKNDLTCAQISLNNINDLHNTCVLCISIGCVVYFLIYTF